MPVSLKLGTDIFNRMISAKHLCRLYDGLFVLPGLAYIWRPSVPIKNYLHHDLRNSHSDRAIERQSIVIKTMMKKTKTMPSLSDDIIMVILSMLPVKSISRFRCVCKPWVELFKNPNFTKMHLNHAIEENKFNVLLKSHADKGPAPHYRIDLDATSPLSVCNNMATEINVPWENKNPHSRFIGSCNGLLCVDFDYPSIYGDKILFWNPSTREYKKIPKPPISRRSHDIVYGFGYDQKIDDYKLIRVVSYSLYDTHSKVVVYTLGTNSWEKKENIPYNVVAAKFSTKPSNGALHWIAKKGMNKMDPEKATKVIVSFDIAEEVTKEIQMPSCFKTHPVRVETLGVLCEDLYLSVDDDSGNKFDVWVYGVADSWTKFLSVSKEQANWLSRSAIFSLYFGQTKWLSLTPLQLFNKNGGEILFKVVCYIGIYKESSLVSYDPKNGEVSRIWDVLDIPDFFYGETYVESLVSLNSGEYI